MGSSSRRSLRLGPLRINFPRSGIALTASVRGARVPIGPRGNYVGFGLAGFFYQVNAKDAHGAGVAQAALTQAAPDAVIRDIEVRSRRWKFFRGYLWVAGGLLLLSLGSAAEFLVMLVVVSLAGVAVRRWDRERRTTRIFYDVDNDEIVGRLALSNVAGEALARSSRLWYVFSSNATLDRKYRTGAGSPIRRTATRCRTGSLDGIELNVDCWTVSLGPQQVLLLPDRILVRQGTRCGSVQYEDLVAIHETTRFVEVEGVPPDGQVVDTTWRFMNKSGGPDLRFKNNVRLPVVAYGELTLRSGAGLQIVLQASNAAAMESAAVAIQELARIARAPAIPTWPSPTSGPRAQREPELPAQRRGSALPAAPVSRGTPLRPISRSPAAPAVAPIVAPLRAAPRAAPHTVSPEARFLGASEPLRIAGRTINAPLTYVAANSSRSLDASTIVVSLPVGDASRALPLPYWPRYAEADPDQRARYLDWMATGRADPSIPVAYAFIFFYGLERRVLLDEADHELARAEVGRLLGIHAESRSFRRYGSDFLAFTALRHPERLLQMSESAAITTFRPLVAEGTMGLASLVGWYHAHRRPLPAEPAALVARSMDNAKRGTVVTRSAVELLDLFSIRYRGSFGDGLVPEAAKRPLTIEYHPASATLLGLGRSITATLPDVLGRTSQFRQVVSVWNACIDDLRKANAKKRSATHFDAAAWTALPGELRAEYDHPDQDTWDSAFAGMPVLAGFRLARVGQLADLLGAERSHRVSAAQMKKIAARASDVGYAIEPDPRLRARAVESEAELLIWRTPTAGPPDAKLYGAVFTMLSLAMMIAMADGVFTREENDVVNSFLLGLFTLDDGMRVRVEAMKQLMARDPAHLGSVAKTLKLTRTSSELAKIAAVLVAIAAADGTVAEAEERALRSFYRSVGLPASDLSAAIARTGARLERDATVEAQSASMGAGGVRIPAPPAAVPVLQLDRAAIEAIVADTRDVAAILADVFATDSDDPSSTPAMPTDLSTTLTGGARISEVPRASETTAKLANGLDVRYQAVLETLLTKDSWTAVEIRGIAERHRLMPAAIVDTVNAWSDDVLGDFLIEDAGDWTIRRDLAKVSA